MKKYIHTKIEESVYEKLHKYRANINYKTTISEAVEHLLKEVQ